MAVESLNDYLLWERSRKRRVIVASLAQQYCKTWRIKSELTSFRRRNMKRLHAGITLLGFSVATTSAWLCEVAATETQSTFIYVNKVLGVEVRSSKF